MATRVTTKGQVTIPKRVRDALGVKPGSAVDIQYRDGCAIIRPAKPARTKSDIRKAFESLRGTIDLGMTTDEYMKLMRGDD
jgi:AbrB family looped-hinge helix DNA binding protein